MILKSRNYILALLAPLMAVSVSACSVKHVATKSLADALSEQGISFGSDEDPELVGDALPFALKLMESVRDSAPEHRGIHLALSSGFVQYAYGWVLWPANRTEDEDFRHSLEMKRRANRLFLRAYGYALTGLELAAPGFQEARENDPAKALDMLGKENAPQLYWLAAALAMAVGTDLENTDMIQRLPEVGLLLERALALDCDWNDGAIHEALVSYYSAVGESLGGGEEKARPHYERALELSGGTRPGVYLAWAEGFSVKRQDRAEFKALCLKALEVDLDERPETRLNGAIMKRRARWLLRRVDDLFLE